MFELVGQMAESAGLDPVGTWNRARRGRPMVAPEPFQTDRTDPLARLLAFAGRDPDWMPPS